MNRFTLFREPEACTLICPRYLHIQAGKTDMYTHIEIQRSHPLRLPTGNAYSKDHLRRRSGSSSMCDLRAGTSLTMTALGHLFPSIDFVVLV